MLTTWTLTMDRLKDLTGLDPLELGSYNGYDQCNYMDPDSNVDILQDTDSDLNIVQLNIRGLIGKQGKLCVSSNTLSHLLVLPSVQSA